MFTIMILAIVLLMIGMKIGYGTDTLSANLCFCVSSFFLLILSIYSMWTEKDVSYLILGVLCLITLTRELPQLLERSYELFLNLKQQKRNH